MDGQEKAWLTFGSFVITVIFLGLFGSIAYNSYLRVEAIKAGADPLAVQCLMR